MFCQMHLVHHIIHTRTPTRVYQRHFIVESTPLIMSNPQWDKAPLMHLCSKRPSSSNPITKCSKCSDGSDGSDGPSPTVKTCPQPFKSYTPSNSNKDDNLYRPFRCGASSCDWRGPFTTYIDHLRECHGNQWIPAREWA